MNNTTNLIQPDFIKFSLLLLFAIPSTFCSIYIIFSFFRFSSIRKSFYYEIIIYLCLITLLRLIFNITISLGYYARGYIIYKSKQLCHFWQYGDYASSGCVNWCLAIFAIERYIMIFYPHYLRFQRQKIIFHYLPIIISNFYIIIFYTVSIIIITSCNNEDYSKHECGEACFETIDSLSSFNWLFNTLVPVFIIIFGSLTLLIRVLWTRRKMQRNLRNWSKNWKMMVQLLGIAAIYTFVWLPLSIISLLDTFGDKERFDHLLDNYMYYLTYLTEISLPIVVFICSPEINRRLCRRIPLNVIGTVSRTH